MIKPLRGEIVIENHLLLGKAGEKPKLDVRHLAKILEFLVTDKYERDELEAIFYLIKLFLKSKKQIYTSYGEIYKDIIKESKEVTEDKKRFRFLKSGKNLLIALLNRLKIKEIILVKELDGENTNQNSKLREKLGMGERGPAKYFKFNFEKLEADLNLPAYEIYFLLDFLVLKHHEFNPAMDEVYKIQDYLESIREVILK